MSLPVDEIYARQIRPLSDDEKRQLVELIAHELASGNGRNGGAKPRDPEGREVARAHFRRHAGAASLGRATGASNESIDADLAREYGADPESN